MTTRKSSTYSVLMFSFILFGAFAKMILLTAAFIVGIILFIIAVQEIHKKFKEEEIEVASKIEPVKSKYEGV